jgi:hypothetical protein
MGRPKSLVKNIDITEAKRAHSCKSNKNHKIQKGGQRLTVKEGQSERNYCMECGKKFIDSALEELNRVRSENWKE